MYFNQFLYWFFLTFCTSSSLVRERVQCNQCCCCFPPQPPSSSSPTLEKERGGNSHILIDVLRVPAQNGCHGLPRKETGKYCYKDKEKRKEALSANPPICVDPWSWTRDQELRYPQRFWMPVMTCFMVIWHQLQKMLISCHGFVDEHDSGLWHVFESDMLEAK